MNEVEAAGKALQEIGNLGAVVVAALVLLVVAILLLVWMFLSFRADMKDREVTAAREKADREAAENRTTSERKNSDTLLQALVGHVAANREISDRLIKVLDGSNEAQRTAADAIEKNTGLIKLAIAETGDKIRETREDIDGVGKKVELIVPVVEDGTGRVLTQLGTVLDELGKMRTALTDNIEQSNTSNAQLRDVFKTGLDAISEAIVKMVVIDTAKPVDAPKRSSEPVVQVIAEIAPAPSKSTPTNGIHKVDAPAPETKPEEPK